MQALLKRLLSAAADLVFPRSCVHCSEIVEHADYQFLCRSCARQIIFSTSPACPTCGYPYSGQFVGPRACPHCTELAPAFDEGKILFLAKGPGRTLLHELKYHSGFYVLNDLARMVSENPSYCDYLIDGQLVPVPLHWDKQRDRGFNQSERIAGMLAAATGSMVAKLLVRTQFTQTQTQLDRPARHQNVKNAFAMAPNATVIPAQQYILIDDVFTTGSTLNACAAVLRKAGAQKIKVATLGHG